MEASIEGHKVRYFCELVLPEKSDKEQILFEKWKRRINYASIPEHLVKEFNDDLETLKLKEK